LKLEKNIDDGEEDMQGVCVAKMQAASKATISQIMPFRLAENVKKSGIASHEFVDSAQKSSKT